MDAQELERILDEQLRRLIARHARIDDDLRNAIGDRSFFPIEQQERAQLLENDDVLARLDVAARDQLAAIRAQLERLEAGTWHTCERCGAEIEERRLRALPTTRLCAHCAKETGASGAV